MTDTLTHTPLSGPAPLPRLAARLLARLRPARPDRAPATQPKGSDRRSFVMDMLDRNADAFAREEDVRAMMSHFPAAF